MCMLPIQLYVFFFVFENMFIEVASDQQNQRKRKCANFVDDNNK